MTQTRVAVIDDDPNVVAAIRIGLEDESDMSPVTFPEGFDSLAQAISLIMSGAEAAVCDHRLQPRNYAPFDGSELVGELVRRGFPAVLRTSFSGNNFDPKIRVNKHDIPVMLGPSSTGHEIVAALDTCRREIGGEVSAERRTWRTFVRIVAQTGYGADLILRAIVPAWNAEEIVDIPSSIIPQVILDEIAATEKPRIYARVNLDAAAAQDLFFDDFETPPNPDPDDGLA